MKTMNEQLMLLIKLQKIDSTILETRHKIDEIPTRISKYQGPLNSAEEAYKRTKQQYEILEKQKRGKEDEIRDIEEKIKKLKQRTSEIKTNKEYQAHLKEIEQTEKLLRATEDELLTIMDSLEGMTKVLKIERERIEAEKKKIEEIKRNLEQDVLKHENELKKLKEERSRLVQSIDKDIYENYMFILNACKGVAVTEVKNEVCQGCNMRIPPQLFVKIKTSNEIIQCPQCSRILYYLQPTPAEASS